MSLSTAEIKRRTREQWSSDPCGAVYGDGYSIGTREFFDSVEAHRYGVYAPWMPEVMEFAAFAGRERVLAAYEQAVRQRYRFYSYGDAMLIQ